MGQEAVFLNKEGDEWFNRNYIKVEEAKDRDPIFTMTNILGIKPAKIIEVGCSNGWRLDAYKRRFPECECSGFDPSAEAVKTGKIRYPDLHLIVAGAAQSEISLGGCDLLIFGFCLYLCDRNDLSMIVGDHDTCLDDGGHLVIHDFDPDHPHKVPYHHVPGLFSYKMDYSKLWLVNPAYSLVTKTKLSDGTAVWVLKKDIEAGWPLEQLK